MKRQKPIILTILGSAFIIAVYLFFRHQGIETSIIIDCLAIFTAVAFFLEYHQNNRVNEGQFVIDLNNQFINEGNLAVVEHDLEMYYTHPDEIRIITRDLSSCFQSGQRRIKLCLCPKQGWIWC